MTTLFAALLRGATGGFAGGAAAHIVVAALNRFANADQWLKGPHGPSFFNLALFMGILYGSIGLALSGRPKTALAGCCVPLLGIALPMSVMTRTLSCGPMAWVYSVSVIFIAAVWGAVFLLGWLSGRDRRWLSGLGAMAGSFAGYLALSAALKLAPGLALWPWRVGGLLPQPTVLLDGLFTGSGMAAGIWLAARHLAATKA